MESIDHTKFSIIILTAMNGARVNKIMLIAVQNVVCECDLVVGTI